MAFKRRKDTERDSGRRSLLGRGDRDPFAHLSEERESAEEEEPWFLSPDLDDSDGFTVEAGISSNLSEQDLAGPPAPDGHGWQGLTEREPEDGHAPVDGASWVAAAPDMPAFESPVPPPAPAGDIAPDGLPDLADLSPAPRAPDATDLPPVPDHTPGPAPSEPFTDAAFAAFDPPAPEPSSDAAFAAFDPPAPDVETPEPSPDPPQAPWADAVPDVGAPGAHLEAGSDATPAFPVPPPEAEVAPSDGPAPTTEPPERGPDDGFAAPGAGSLADGQFSADLVFDAAELLRSPPPAPAAPAPDAAHEPGAPAPDPEAGGFGSLFPEIPDLAEEELDPAEPVDDDQRRQIASVFTDALLNQARPDQARAGGDPPPVERADVDPGEPVREPQNGYDLGESAPRRVEPRRPRKRPGRPRST